MVMFLIVLYVLEEDEVFGKGLSTVSSSNLWLVATRTDLFLHVPSPANHKQRFLSV
jgi:hypothetical protein